MAFPAFLKYKAEMEEAIRMATKELDILMQRRDAAGNIEVHYPITRMENVEGLAEAIDQAAQAGQVRQELDSHKADTALHVTTEKQAAWEAAAVQAGQIDMVQQGLDAHKADATLHVTAEKQAAWEAAAAQAGQIDGMQQGLDVHKEDTTLHVTAEKQAAWETAAAQAGQIDGVQQDLDTHKMDTALHVTAEKQAQWAAAAEQALHDKRPVSFVVGTALSGHTEKDVDYLCTGTDDQTSIQAAIAALPEAGGKIVIREGGYSLSDSIIVSHDAVTLEGIDGNTQLVRAFAGAGTQPAVLYIAGQGCTVRGITVDGNKSAFGSTEVHGIYIAQADQMTVYGCSSKNNTGCGIYGTGETQGHIIMSNKLTDNSVNGLLFCNDIQKTLVKDNRCMDNGDSGAELNGAQDTIIEANFFEGNTRYGVRTARMEQCLLSGNLIKGNKNSGMYMSKPTDDTNICNNVFMSNSRTGLSVYTITSSVIQNNIFGYNNSGLYTSNIYHSMIANNCSHDNTKYGFEINGMTDCVLSGNRTDNNKEIGISCSVEIMDCVVSQNICNDNGETGLQLAMIDNGVIMGNLCQRNTSDGMKISDANRSSVIGNMCMNNRYGLRVMSGDNMMVSTNFCINNTSGQLTDNSTNSLVEGNKTT